MNSTTIKPNELVANLEILRGKIARKPSDYVPRKEYPESIDESFSSYTRTSHVNMILAFSDVLRELGRGWPFPFFMLSSLPSITSPSSNNCNWILAVSRLARAWFFVNIWFDSLRTRPSEEGWSAEEFEEYLNKLMVRLVRLSCGELFCRWRSKELFVNHQQQLNEIQAVYRKGYWYPCVTATFPLLDHVCRKLLKTNNLTRGIGRINKVFEDAKIDLESLRPGSGAWHYAKKIGVEAQELSNKDLRLVGVALESFLKLAREYYGHSTSDEEVSVLNRHAVLHGAGGRVWTREDATKLLLFLDLMLILVPTFEILLAPTAQYESQGTGESRHNS